MASINGIWFLLTGMIVTIVSLFNQDLRIFLFVGIIFIVYGSIKLILEIFSKPKENKPQNGHASHHQHKPLNQSHQQENKNQHHSQNPNQHGFFCRNCGKRLALHDNFCSHCGIRLK